MLSPLNLDQANTSRDSITMAVYSYLFDWIIRKHRIWKFYDLK